MDTYIFNAYQSYRGVAGASEFQQKTMINLLFNFILSFELFGAFDAAMVCAIFCCVTAIDMAVLFEEFILTPVFSSIIEEKMDRFIDIAVSLDLLIESKDSMSKEFYEEEIKKNGGKKFLYIAEAYEHICSLLNIDADKISIKFHVYEKDIHDGKLGSTKIYEEEKVRIDVNLTGDLRTDLDTVAHELRHVWQYFTLSTNAWEHAMETYGVEYYNHPLEIDARDFARNYVSINI